MSKYTCSNCNETYEKIRSDEDCHNEMVYIMPESEHDNIDILCDDCYRDFMEWFKTLSEEQKRNMRDEHVKSNYQ